MEKLCYSFLYCREVDGKVCHTYAFQSERNKLDWVNDLRYSKRKLSESHHP